MATVPVRMPALAICSIAINRFSAVGANPSILDVRMYSGEFGGGNDAERHHSSGTLVDGFEQIQITQHQW